VVDVFGRVVQGGAGTTADSWTWHTAPAGTPAATEESFAPLAARQAVSFLARAQDQVSLENMDSIHAVAVEHSIVTPWSSMIVLVNERQRDALKEASAKKDRFEREVERGGADQTPELFATPEPGEWLLMGLAMMGLLVLRKHQEAFGLV
jgi:putative PEP-CTERM system integral membrane protein